MNSATTFLMFQGNASAALKLYEAVFEDFNLEQLDHDDAGTDGQVTVSQAVFTLAGTRFRVIDSPPVHDFGFTPSISIFVECSSEAEIDQLHAELSDGGQIMMALDNYEFSRRFCWLQDRFGVSWQLNLA